MPNVFKEYSKIIKQSGASVADRGVYAAFQGTAAKATLSTPDRQLIEFQETAEGLKDAKADQIYTVKSMSALAGPLLSNQLSPSSLKVTLLAQATGFAKGLVTCSNPADVGKLKAPLKPRKELQLLLHQEVLLQRTGDLLVKSCPQKERELFLIKDSSTLDGKKLKRYCNDRGVTLHILLLPRDTTKLLHPLYPQQLPKHKVFKLRQEIKMACGHSKDLRTEDLLELMLARSKSYSSQSIQRAFRKTLEFLQDPKALASFGRLCSQEPVVVGYPQIYPCRFRIRAILSYTRRRRLGISMT